MSNGRPELAPGQHLAARMLERLAFEPEAVTEGVRAHAAGCDACRAEVERLAAERRAFLAERPARPFMAGVAERAEEAARLGRPTWLEALRRGRWLLVPAAAAAAVLLVMIVPRGSPEPGHVHFKGGGALRLYLAHGGGEALPLEPRAAARPGDLLRFGVLEGQGRFAFVASVDEAGRFSRYYPREAAGAGPLPGTAGLELLPGSIELDETLGREWIVLLLSPRPLDEAAVRPALLAAWQARTGDRLGPIDLDADVDVVPLRKVPP